MHWTQISTNPNLPELIGSRNAALTKARRSPLEDRISYLCGLARGKQVLDVGCVNHLSNGNDDPNWLHGRLSAVARCCTGVDVLENSVNKLRREGFDIVLCDITADLGQTIPGKFELITCGELIEHLGCPSRLFEAAARLLMPGGLLVLTTPNPFYLGRVLRHLFNVPCESVDHVTMLFPSGIAEMADRAGLELAEYRGVHPQPLTAKRRAFRPFRWAVMKTMNAEAACDTLVYACRKPLDVGRNGTHSTVPDMVASRN